MLIWYNIEKCIESVMVTSQYLFPQQIAYDDIENFEDIQDSLVEWMYHYQKYNNNAKVSNKGGWQSASKEIFSDQGFKMFERPIIGTILEVSKVFKLTGSINIVQMWMNINTPYSYNITHRHPGSQLSGVLWVKQTAEMGRFVFDNIDNRNIVLGTKTNNDHLIEHKMCAEILPPYQDGTILLFPSEMSHRVEMNETNEDRLSISFNITIN